MSSAPTRPVIRVTPDTLSTHIEGPAWFQLAPGRYTRDLRIHGPDVVLEPAAEGEVEWWRCTITAESADRLQLRGLTFRQSPRTSVGIQGPSREVRVERCRFLACGTGGAVTVWLGSGTRHCRVEACEFDLLGLVCAHAAHASHTHSIAIMAAEKDCAHHAVLGNRISHYDYGIQLGETGTCEEEGRHLVAENILVAPRTDGIHVKAGACRIENNRVVGARLWSISARAGHDSVFQGNCVEDGYTGMNIRGKRHQVVGNRFVRIRAHSLCLLDAKANGDGFAAEDTVVEGNQFIDCGGADAGQPMVTAPGLEGPPLAESKGLVVASPLPQRLGRNDEGP